MDLAALQALLGNLPGKRVACVGDLMVDRFVYGSVTRVSPEAPIPVLARSRELKMLGAAGEVEQRLIRTIRDAARGAGVVLISDYGKGVVTDAVIAAAREAAAETGAKVIVDSKARSFSRY